MSEPDLLDLIKAAQERADDGMARAADHAERVEQGWADRAFAALLAFAAGHLEFTAEQARKGCHAAGLSLPPDGRAWGGVFKRAANQGRIEATGRYAPRLSGNMTPTIVWRAK